MAPLQRSLRRRFLRALAVGLVTNVVCGQLALAHTPVAGAVKESASSTSLSYRWGGIDVSELVPTIVDDGPGVRLARPDVQQQRDADLRL